MKILQHGFSVKWKIYSIAIVSLIGFAGYLGFNVWVTSNNANLLASVRDTYYPILEKATTNRVNLDRLTELLSTAASTGETDLLKTAETAALNINSVFDEVVKLEPDKKDDVKQIQTLFSEYYNAVYSISNDMASGDVDFATLPDRIKKKEEVFKDLSSKLEAFKTYSNNNFASGIRVANENSNTLLTSGFVIWLVSVICLSVFVYAIAKLILSSITQVSNSLHEIASGSGDLNTEVTVASSDEIGELASSFNGLLANLRQKANDLMCMMHNMHQGLFTIIEDESIHPEYATYLEEIFETDHVAGKNYSALLFSRAKLGSNELDQVETAVASLIDQDEMMWEFNSHLLITEYNIYFVCKNGVERTKIIELDWDPIITEGVIKKIMVTVRDVTQVRALQAEAEAKQEELEMIGQILSLPADKFSSFIKNSTDLLEKNRQIINDHPEKDKKVIADLFVNMHTVKGNTRTYGFSFATDVIHEAETTYDKLRKEDDKTWSQEELLHELDLVEESIQRYKTVKERDLNFDSTMASDGDVILKQEVYQKMLRMTAYLTSVCVNQKGINLSNMFKGLNSSPLEYIIHDLEGSLPSVAKQLGKAAPEVIFKGDQVRIKNKYSDVIKNVFTHLLRNSIDHGIESIEEREQKNKSPQGKIQILMDYEDENAKIVLNDDGRGLAINRIKNKALENGDIKDSQTLKPADVANLLFLSGVSTAEKLTDISGRGVGMDAVKSYLEQHNANIKINLKENDPEFKKDFVPFELELTLPMNMCEKPPLLSTQQVNT